MTDIGKWYKKGGDIWVTLGEGIRARRIRYLGDDETPTSPTLVGADLSADLKIPVILIKTHRYGGIIQGASE